MDKNSLDFFKKLISTMSPSGFEEQAVKLWEKRVKTFVNKVSVDANGSGIALLGKGSGKKIMIAAHIDEIGFMVQHVDKQGFIYFSPVGGVDKHIVPGKRVWIHTDKGVILGVVGRKPIHQMQPEERNKVSKFENMWIDIGVKSEKEAFKKVSIGDYAVPAVGFEEINKDIFIGRGFDDRAGVWVMTEVMRLLSKVKLSSSVYGVATVQEELGLRGARTSAYGINPDIGIAIDVTFATDAPGMDKRKIGDIKIGKGPVITRGPNINNALFKEIVSVAKKNKIPHQIEANSHPTGTDANAIQMTRAGVPTVLVSIPNRYMHTPVEMVCGKDMENAVKLITAFVKSISKKK